MMGKLTAVLTLSLVASVAACAETPTGAISPVDIALSETTVPTASGPVWVIGHFELEIGIGGNDAGVNKHPQEKGSCHNAEGVEGSGEGFTFWHAPGASEATTGAKFCQETTAGDTQSVTCETDPIAATYAFGGEGAPQDVDPLVNNENLNFTDLEWLEEGVFVHFNASRQRYKRQGTLEDVGYTCDLDISGETEINLAATTSTFQFDSSTSRKLAPVEFDTDEGTGEGWLEWEYRSRNDIPPTTP
jgi:hypothetical protein